jgi:hypothetical protein
MGVLLLPGANLSGESTSALAQGVVAPSTLGGLLPGEDAIGPAALDQDNPQIAAGAGGYLVVWEDSRGNHASYPGNAVPTDGSASGQTLKDIFAARLDANGNLIDTIPLAVSQAPWDQTRPRVAWNGQYWLVVWNTLRATSYSSTTDVAAARISPTGAVLDNPAIVVDGTDAVDELYPEVTSDGTGWTVMWMDQGSYYELDAARISADGVNRNPGGVAIYTPQFPDAPYNATIAFAGDEYMVVAPKWGANDDDIIAFRLSTALQRVGGIIPISAALGYQETPSITSNGTDYFLAWRDNRDLQTYQVFGARITHAGTVLDPNGIAISGANGGYPSPRVAWDGTRWYATWDTYGNNVRVARIATTGAVLNPGGTLVAGATAIAPAISAIPGGGARIVWADTRAGGTQASDIYSAGISATGVVGSAACTSLGAPAQVHARMAANGNGYMVAFQSRVSGETRIRVQRLDANGNSLDAQPILIIGGSTSLVNPSVAWNGSAYLVVWEDTSTGQGFAPGMIVGKRVRADGTIIDSTPITIMPGNAPDVSAMGDNFLVTSTHEPVNHQRVPKAVRVSGSSGAVLGSPATLGTIFATQTRATVLGSRWLVVWQSNPSHDNPYATIRANFVNADGTLSGEFLVANTISSTPDVAAKADQALIAFYNGGDVRARRILPNGTLLDGATGFQVTTVPNAQFFPAVAWDGFEYVVAYEDYRSVPYLDRPVSDIYATRVDASATVRDPSGFLIANSRLPEVLPEVAALDGRYLVAFSNFRQGAPYASYRIEVQSFAVGMIPTPAPTNTPTATATPYGGTETNYSITQQNGVAIVPGTDDIGLHCGICRTTIQLPFPVQLYDRSFTTAVVGSSGVLQFASNADDYNNYCLPYAAFNYAIMPLWDNADTDELGDGVFTSVSGSAPNRILNIEWRTHPFLGSTANYEVRLYEGTNRFDMVYGSVQFTNSATIGVQQASGQRSKQYACNVASIVQEGLQMTFTMPASASATPTNTPRPPTATNTPLPPPATATFTAIATATTPPTLVPTNTPVPPTPDFTLSVSPASQTVNRPGSITYTVTLNPVNGYSGSVTLTVSGLPNKASRSFNPNPVALSSGSRTATLSITVERGAPRGTYTLTIQGTGGSRTHVQNVTLVIR